MIKAMYYADLHVFCTPDVLRAASELVPSRIAELVSLHTEAVSLSCEPDNMLLNEAGGRPGTLYRVVVHAAEPLRTEQVMSCFAEDTLWYGSSGTGEIDPGVSAACAWR
ncbi:MULTISPECIES: hypothetical protein [Corynebacterium]|nr:MULTISPECIES: hypothetical protein [Corynebacterium]MBV7301735.1 hypothetical protein [Corynebacterium sp. TAE3-ERU2]